MNRRARRALAARNLSGHRYRTETRPPKARRALLVGASCLALAVALGAARDAKAVNECGVVAAGGTATCNHDGAPATDANPYPGGIRYQVVDLTIVVTNGAIINTTTKAGEPGGISSGGLGAFGDVLIQSGTMAGSGVTITTDGFDAQGIDARTFDGAIGIVSNSTIKTSGGGSSGIQALAFGDVLINSKGAITTSGSNSVGIAARAEGIDSDLVIKSNGAITTTGSFGIGIFGQTVDEDGDIAIISKGSIITSGIDAAGISIRVGDGDGIVNSVGDILTKGKDSDGLYARTYDGDITITSIGNIRTTANDAEGIDAQVLGAGDVKITSMGNITALGVDSDGILGKSGLGGGTIEIASVGDVFTRFKDSDGLEAWGDTSAKVTSIGNVRTLASYADGILAYSGNVATIVSVGDVNTAGDNARAVFATGASVTITSVGDVATSGRLAPAIVAEATGGDVKIVSVGNVSTGNFYFSPGIVAAATGSVSITSVGDISIKGDESDAIHATAGGDITIVSIGDITQEISAAIYAKGDGEVKVTSVGDISIGDESVGILAYSTADDVFVTSAGNLTTAGDGVDGIVAKSSAETTNVTIVGSLTTSGRNSRGIFIYGGEVSTIKIGGDVTGGWTGSGAASYGAGLVVHNGNHANVEISAAGSIAGLNEIAIRGENPGITITNSGTIDGNLWLGGFEGNTLNNAAGGVWNLRQFEDFDGDGTRDRESIALTDFGESSFNQVQNDGTLRLAPVLGAAYSDTFITLAHPAPGGFSDLTVNGVEQGVIGGLDLFVNRGTVDMQDGVANDLLLITDQPAPAPGSGAKPGNGMFLSSGGTLRLDVFLDDGSSQDADVLMVDRAAQNGGPTTIQVTNIGGPGGQTKGNGIMVVNVRTASSGDAFALAGPLVAGAYKYDLFFQDLIASDFNWYLRSSEFAGALAYPAIANSALTAWRADLLALQDRMKGLRGRIEAAQSLRMPASVAGISDGGTVPVNPALLAGGWFAQTDSSSDVAQFGSADFTQQTAGTQFGYDFAVDNVLSRDDWLVFGAFGGQGWSQADFAEADASADFETETMGAYASWFSGNLHVDALMKYSLLDGEFSSDAVRGGDALTVPVFGTSLGAGYRLDLTQSETGGLWLQPAIGFDYAHVGGDSFTDDSGARIRLSDTDSLRGRLGARLVQDFAPAEGESGPKGSFYFELGVAQELLGGAEAEVSGVIFRQDLPKTTFELGAGFDIALPEEGVSFTFDTGADFSEGEDSFGATGGVRIAW